MENKKRKRLMTDVAKGKLTMEAAGDLLDSDLKLQVTETKDTVIMDIEEITLEEVKPKKKTKTKSKKVLKKQESLE